jgi:predicted nucleic acid-binding Zn ribbon protein
MNTSQPTHQDGQNMRQNAVGTTIFTCPVCGTSKPRKRRWETFCSPRCRKAAWVLNHRTGTYTDIRKELADIKAMLVSLGAKT